MDNDSKSRNVMVRNLHTKREEWLVARALEAAVLAADSAYSSVPSPYGDNDLEDQMDHNALMRTAANTAHNVNEVQIETTIIILRLAQRIAHAGGILIQGDRFRVIGE